MKIDIIPLPVKQDERGFLFEVLRREEVGEKLFGHLLISVAHPGRSKGGHYHKKKYEWFCVIKGEAILNVVDNKTKESLEIPMGDTARVLVKLYPFTTHSITNTGNEDVYLLAYTDLPFDSRDQDTFYD